MKKQGSKIIMGIDPGTSTTGYGVVEIQGKEMRCLILGDIDLHKIKDPYLKLNHIFERIGSLIEAYRPDEVALESPFFGKNIQSMLKLGRAQGVAMAAALSKGCPVFEYAPRVIKQAITGRGGATKEQVAALLKALLKLEELPKRLDASDGLAVAVCHYFQSSMVRTSYAVPLKKALGGGQRTANWSSFVANNPKRVKGI